MSFQVCFSQKLWRKPTRATGERFIHKALGPTNSLTRILNTLQSFVSATVGSLRCTSHSSNRGLFLPSINQGRSPPALRNVIDIDTRLLSAHFFRSERQFFWAFPDKYLRDLEPRSFLTLCSAQKTITNNLQSTHRHTDTQTYNHRPPTAHHHHFHHTGVWLAARFPFFSVTSAQVPNPSGRPMVLATKQAAAQPVPDAGESETTVHTFAMHG